jgi:hypothetical protein
VNVRPILFVTLAGALATGACAAPGPKAGVAAPGATTTSAAPAPAKDPKDLLSAAVPDAKAGPVAFTVTGPDPLSGVFDAAKQRIRFDIEQKLAAEHITISMNFLLIEKKTWLKMAFSGSGAKALPAVPKKWMLLDPAKMGKDNGFSQGLSTEGGAGNAGVIIDAATGVVQSAPGHFSGTTDISGTDDGDLTDAATLKALGDKAKAVPFEAITDGQGRLTSILVKIPAAGKAKATQYEEKYSGYGTTDSPAEPTAAEQAKPTQTVYDFLKG